MARLEHSSFQMQQVPQVIRRMNHQPPIQGHAAGSAEMCMRRRAAPAARARPVVPVGPTAGGAASYSAVQLRRGQRTTSCPTWARGLRRLAEHAARCRSCGVADGVVYQVGPSGTALGSSELVKAHTPRRGRPSCRNTPSGGLVWAAPWSVEHIWFVQAWSQLQRLDSCSHARTSPHIE